MMFATEQGAQAFFGVLDVEECEVCGDWSASEADHPEGEIIGPCVNPQTGDPIHDRLCKSCDDAVADEENEDETMHCRKCGTEITDADYDDNHGMYNQCSGGDQG